MEKGLKMRNKTLLFVAPLLAIFLMGLVTPAIAAGEGINTNKANIKANVPLTFTGTGLTVSTYYTFYVESTLLSNKSTSATATTMDFKVVVTDDFMEQWVTMALKAANGTTTLATLEMEVVAVVPQYTLDMIGAFIPLIIVFSTVFGLITGIVLLVTKIVQ